jgi:predicted MPP superfamily phosphohydrolase
VKIIHLADLHLQHSWFDWVASRTMDYDLLVLAGDLQNAFSNSGMHDQARAVTRWLLTLPIPTVLCSGNHDYWTSHPRGPVDELAEAAWLTNLRGKKPIIAVDGDVIVFGRCRIMASGWLQVPDTRGHADIVVSHAPPAGCDCACDTNGVNLGDPHLWPALQRTPPTLLLSGHIHAPRQNACFWPPHDPASLVLVPGCDEQSPEPNFWSIDTTTKVATHSDGSVMAYS